MAIPPIQLGLPTPPHQSFLPQHQQMPTQTQTLLLAALSYVVNALPNQSLCLQAGIALRNLCDANRKALAPQIAAFGELHNNLGSIPVCFLFSSRGNIFKFHVRTPKKARCSNPLPASFKHCHLNKRFHPLRCVCYCTCLLS